MINVYIVSGFLGAGKTTFIQKLLREKKFEKVMLLENEFGEVGVDGAFFDENLKVREINNGCICCSLQGDFEDALEEIESYDVSDLIIEPSGVGKLSEIINIITKDEDFRIVSHVCVVDVNTAVKYHTNFKEYFDDQVVSANTIILSHLDATTDEKKNRAVEMIKEINDEAHISDRPVDEYEISDLMDIIVKDGGICFECCCGHHDHDDHDHHHIDHDEEHEHHHDHDHEHEHHHDHDHHHHHDDEDEDEIFKNVVYSPEYIFTKEELESILSKMEDDIIRVKGYVFGKNNTMLYFNYILNEYNVYEGRLRDTSLVSVIGTELHKDELKEVFHG